MPTINPTRAGIMLARPSLPVISIEGISSDHTEAATITPAAKPVSPFCTCGAMPRRIMNTHAEPSAVPKNGNNMPTIKLSIKDKTQKLQYSNTESRPLVLKNRHHQADHPMQSKPIPSQYQNPHPELKSISINYRKLFV